MDQEEEKRKPRTSSLLWTIQEENAKWIEEALKVINEEMDGDLNEARLVYGELVLRTSKNYEELKLGKLE